MIGQPLNPGSAIPHGKCPYIINFDGFAYPRNPNGRRFALAEATGNISIFWQKPIIRLPFIPLRRQPYFPKAFNSQPDYGIIGGRVIFQIHALTALKKNLINHIGSLFLRFGKWHCENILCETVLSGRSSGRGGSGLKSS